ncbi:hypothetical protein TNCV_4111691 [Trichonephila clavipes]|nr:hypothetical protein TNCV_4111691 [Trichonephila clavipes]
MTAAPASLVAIGNKNTNAKSFDLIPALSNKIKGFSAIRIQVLVLHPETLLVSTFSTPAPASSALEGGQYYRPALSGKVTEVSKVRFQILVPHPEKHQDRTLHTARILSVRSDKNSYSLLVTILARLVILLEVNSRLLSGDRSTFLPCHLSIHSFSEYQRFYKTNISPPGIVVSDADCCAVGPWFESRRRHGCL